MDRFLSNPVYKAALNLAKAKIPVFPLNGKKPIESGGFHTATTNCHIISEKWNYGRANWNIGVPTGLASNLFILDIDNKPGQANGYDSLAHLAIQFGALPATVTQFTGYGTHYFFRCPVKRIPCSVGSIGPGIDIRGDGGYVLIAPSMHPETGKPYQWAIDRSPAQIAVSEAPEWLLEKIWGTTLYQAIQNQPIPIKRHVQKTRKYGLKALAAECLAIRFAPNGHQEQTLNKAAYSIGTLIGANVLNEETAIQELEAAAFNMVSYDQRRPWKKCEITRKIKRGISQGKLKPRGLI